MSAEQQQKSDVQLVELTKVRLQNLARKQRLEDLALQFVAANFQLYKDFNLRSQIREKLLQRILQWRFFVPYYGGNLEQFDKMMQALPHLVGERTVSVDFTNIFTFCPSEKIKSSFIKVCELLVQAAPNIEELSMASEYPKLIIQDLLQPLTKMQKLQVLRLGCCEFDRDGLLELCKALPSLRVLSVGCLYYDIEYSGCGNDLSRALQHLRVLEKDDWCPFLLSVFSRVAPQLDCICTWQRDEVTTVRLHEEEEDKTPNQRRRVLYLGLGGESIDGKEELHVNYPFITHLEVSGSFINEYGVDSLDKFQNLKTLVLKSCDLTDVDNLMRVYGQKLRRLHIFADPDTPLEGLTFGRISECGLQLEELDLSDVIIPDADAFPELRDFSWVNSKDVDCVMPLSSILSSPKLENITLQGKYKVEDLRSLATLIEQKKVLRQLQSLHLRKVYTYAWNSNFNMAHFRAAARLAKTASAFLPLLIHVSLSLYNGFFFASCNQMIKMKLVKEHIDKAMIKIFKECEKFGSLGFKP